MARTHAVSAQQATLRRAVLSITATTERTHIVAQIGQFTREVTGFVGRVHTLTFHLELAIVSVDPGDTENAPDYRIHRGSEDGPEVGAGWTRTSDKAGEYISLQLDDPTFDEPIRARLFQNGDDASSWSLHWNRPRERGEKA